MKLIFIFLTAVLLVAPVFAQTSGEVLAKIGSRTLTAADLDAEASKIVERLPLALAELRRSELDREIADLLFAAEAAARKTTTEKLLALEVGKKVVAPTPKQLEEVYEANRESFGNAKFEEVKTRIANYLKREQETKISAAFAQSLKLKHKITPGINVNAANLKSTDVLATVGGGKILAERFNERLKPLEFDLRSAAYRQIKNSLDAAIYANLILLEAERKNLPSEEIVKREINDKLREPTEAEARVFYEKQKAEIPVAFEAARNQILTFLADEQRAKLEDDLNARLLKQYGGEILLKQPAAPVLKISADDDPVKGNQNAPVTIIMFTDFQCPACAKQHPAIFEMLRTYGDKIKVVVRDYPLVDVHEQAFRAAEAAGAAHAQGKFFEYIELLYQNQTALDDASLKRYAAQAGLNVKQFEVDLASGRFAAEIRRDIKDGDFYGIRSTPTIFINNVNLNDLSEENLKAMIEKASNSK